MQTSVDYHKRNFFNTAIADVYRALDGGSHVGSFILTLCLIDQLTWVEFGYQKKAFNQWVEKRLLSLNIFYTGKTEELYSVRCGLIHSYGPSQKLLDRQFEGYLLRFCSPELHLQRINSGVLHICLYSLLTETTFAAHCTFEDLKKSATNEQFQRMEQQLSIQHSPPPEKYGQMHRVLSAMDEPESVSVRSLQADYTRFLLYPENTNNCNR
jgi:hypothetical protein